MFAVLSLIYNSVTSVCAYIVASSEVRTNERRVESTNQGMKEGERDQNRDQLGTRIRHVSYA